jgi:hypothetical protein
MKRSDNSNYCRGDHPGAGYPFSGENRDIQSVPTGNTDRGNCQVDPRQHGKGAVSKTALKLLTTAEYFDTQRLSL